MIQHDRSTGNDSDRLCYRDDNPRSGAVSAAYPTPGNLTSDEINAVFDALSNKRRRRALRVLAAQDIATLGELTERLTDIELAEADADRAAVRKRVYVGLYQTHIPALDDLDVVGWSTNPEDAVLPGPLFEAAEAVLAHADAPVDESEDTGLIERLLAVVSGNGGDA